MDGVDTVLRKPVTSSRTHLDDDQAFPRAEFVGNCAEDFLHRGGHGHPDGCVGVVHAIDFKQHCWEDGCDMVRWFREFSKKTISSAQCLDTLQTLHHRAILTLCIFFFFGIYFLGPHAQHMEVPRLGVLSEQQLPAYTTRGILNPRSEAKD